MAVTNHMNLCCPRYGVRNALGLSTKTEVPHKGRALWPAVVSRGTQIVIKLPVTLVGTGMLVEQYHVAQLHKNVGTSEEEKRLYCEGAKCTELPQV
jgi:hypothetical protein